MIVNLTRHTATAEQTAEGVVEPANKALVVALLTFHRPPTAENLRMRAAELAQCAREQRADTALIGGAPYLMAPLERALRRWGVRPLYSFSRRVATEALQEDGSLQTTYTFRHEAFVPAAEDGDWLIPPVGGRASGQPREPKVHRGE
ncbi:MAG: hypothetical protein K9L28_06905 [Synergistales bacterium]|nr:hypothetical protein [Synergistales bacterium]